MTNLPLLGAVLVLTLGASRAVAQAPPASPPPPLPATTASPVVLRPPTAPPPSAVAPAAAPTAAANRAPTAAPVQPPAPASALPPDSVRPAPAAAPAAPPANGVAQCRDGTFVVAPADASVCASHRGVLVLLPQSGTPRPPAAARMPVSAPAAPRAAAAAAAPAPEGATMRCKDGTYLAGAPSEGRCDAYGGVAALLPAPRTAPPPPLPRRP